MSGFHQMSSDNLNKSYADLDYDDNIEIQPKPSDAITPNWPFLEFYILKGAPRILKLANDDLTQGRNSELNPTLKRIKKGIKYPHKNDGSVFKNREGLLPKREVGYYREYVHPTPGINGPGLQRIVTVRNGEIYYTPNHYESFIIIR